MIAFLTAVTLAAAPPVKPVLLVVTMGCVN